MLTRKQHDLLAFIHQRLQETGVSPSFEEMKEALNLRSKSGVHRLINALVERNFIRRLPNRARALEVIRLPDVFAPSPKSVPAAVGAGGKASGSAGPRAANDDVVEIPLHGRIAAGQPIEALEGDSSLSVPAALLGPGEHFALEVAGDSMIEAGILDGDYALVRRCDSARDGDIVVALVDGAEATLKILRLEGETVRLDPANCSLDPQRYPAERVAIQGRLSGLLRRYH
jgi:repressor LexA